METLTEDTVRKVLNKFKESLFIAPALKSFKVNHFDFFEFLETNENFKTEYEKILKYNNIINEDKVANLCYTGKGNSKILLEMIKANDKKKYNIKTEIEVNTNYKNLSDDALDEMIKKLQNNLT